MLYELEIFISYMHTRTQIIIFLKIISDFLNYIIGDKQSINFYGL